MDGGEVDLGLNLWIQVLPCHCYENRLLICPAKPFSLVIPAQAGIHIHPCLDSCFRRNDRQSRCRKASLSFAVIASRSEAISNHHWGLLRRCAPRNDTQAPGIKAPDGHSIGWLSESILTDWDLATRLDDGCKRV